MFQGEIDFRTGLASAIKMVLCNRLLENGEALVTFTVAGTTNLGTQTTTHIRTGTILGQRVLTLEPSGGGRLRPL